MNSLTGWYSEQLVNFFPSWEVNTSKQIFLVAQDVSFLLEVNSILTEAIYSIIEKYKRRTISLDFINQISGKIQDGYNTLMTKEFSIHLEGDVNICIYFWNILIATLGMERYPNWEIVFSQLQCSKLKERKGNFYVEGFDWKKVLVELWEIFISKLSLHTSIIQPARLHTSELIQKLSHPWERGFNIYDQTALDLGYVYNWKTELYEKHI